jgi:alkylation response protein AidB-like acyl-CoA dehydrogenase
MRRDLFTSDHEAFRELARDFVEKEVVPHYPEWEKGGRMPREVFKQMGALGMLGMAIPEEYGGDPDNRRKGLTLLVVEDGMAGFTRGRELEKMGCKVQDTAELSFVDVRVPAANVLGEEGEAFSYLGHNLPQERLTVAVGSVAQARSAIATALNHPATARRSAPPSPRFRTPSSNSRRARPRSRRPRRCWTGRWRCTWKAS